MIPGRGPTVAERIVEANGVTLCAESFGDPADPPIVLVMGMGSSMLWWPETFCEMLAGGGRFVIRYDHRDTGRSVTYEPGRPGYTGADLVADIAGVLDAFGVAAAHVVGVSAGGALAQLLALDFPGRVRSLVLISTSPATRAERSLPSPTERFNRFLASAEVEGSIPTARCASRRVEAKEESPVCGFAEPSFRTRTGDPPYHGTSHAMGGSRWQRISLVFVVSVGSRFASDCRRLQPRSSIGARSSAGT